jgi:hypothetical protein
MNDIRHSNNKNDHQQYHQQPILLTPATIEGGITTTRTTPDIPVDTTSASQSSSVLGVDVQPDENDYSSSIDTIQQQQQQQQPSTPSTTTTSSSSSSSSSSLLQQHPTPTSEYFYHHPQRQRIPTILEDTIIPNRNDTSSHDSYIQQSDYDNSHDNKDSDYQPSYSPPQSSIITTASTTTTTSSTTETASISTSTTTTSLLNSSTKKHSLQSTSSVPTIPDIPNQSYLSSSSSAAAAAATTATSTLLQPNRRQEQQQQVSSPTLTPTLLPSSMSSVYTPPITTSANQTTSSSSSKTATTTTLPITSWSTTTPDNNNNHHHRHHHPYRSSSNEDPQQHMGTNTSTTTTTSSKRQENTHSNSNNTISDHTIQQELQHQSIEDHHFLPSSIQPQPQTSAVGSDEFDHIHWLEPQQPQPQQHQSQDDKTQIVTTSTSLPSSPSILPDTATSTTMTTSTTNTTNTTTNTSTNINTDLMVVAIKMLISNNVAGSIIGRMGQSISELQIETQTRIKISQSSDYYPNTQDRVCFIQGTTITSVQMAIRYIIERCYYIQKLEHQQQQQQPSTTMFTGYGMINPSLSLVSTNNMNVSSSSGGGDVSNNSMGGDGFDFIIRLLVPVASCGMIIGKSGMNIKYMEETSGVVSVRLSSKDDSTGYSTGTTYVTIPTNERIITITSMTVEQCVQCIYIVLDGMMAHPDISHYTNMTTSYVHNNHHRIQQQQQQQQQLQQEQQQQRVRRIHHLPLQEQQPMYWPSGGGGLQGIQMAQQPGLSRRIASSPNLPVGVSPVYQHQLSARIESHQSGGTHLQYGMRQHQNPHNDGTIHHGTSLQTSDTDVSFTPSTHTMNIQQRYHYHQQQQRQQQHHHHHHPNLYPQQHQLSNTIQQLPQSQIHSGSVVGQSASAPNLLAMQMEQSLYITPSQTHDGTIRSESTSTTTPSSPLTHARLMHPSMFTHVEQPEYHPVVVNDSTIGINTAATALALQVPTMMSPDCFTAQVLVPDTMIGSILGRGGRTLNDLQVMSDTIIRISQRNEFMPGTRSRIVTIRGPNTQTVWQAQYMISQRMTNVLTTAAGVSSSSSTEPTTTPIQYHHPTSTGNTMLPTATTATVTRTPSLSSSSSPMVLNTYNNKNSNNNNNDREPPSTNTTNATTDVVDTTSSIQ